MPNRHPTSFWEGHHHHYHHEHEGDDLQHSDHPSADSRPDSDAARPVDRAQAHSSSRKSESNAAPPPPEVAEAVDVDSRPRESPRDRRSSRRRHPTPSHDSEAPHPVHDDDDSIEAPPSDHDRTKRHRESDRGSAPEGGSHHESFVGLERERRHSGDHAHSLAHDNLMGHEDHDDAMHHDEFGHYYNHVHDEPNHPSHSGPKQISEEIGAAHPSSGDDEVSGESKLPRESRLPKFEHHDGGSVSSHPTADLLHQNYPRHYSAESAHHGDHRVKAEDKAGAWESWFDWWPFKGTSMEVTEVAKGHAGAVGGEAAREAARDSPVAIYDPSVPHPEEHWRAAGWHPAHDRPGSYVTGALHLPAVGHRDDDEIEPGTTAKNPVFPLHHEPAIHSSYHSRLSPYAPYTDHRGGSGYRHEGMLSSSKLTSEDRDGLVNYGALILLVLVLSSLVTGHLSSKYIHKGLTVPVVAIFLGCATAFFIWLGGTNIGFLLHRVIDFNESVFFVFVLPPIIFASGFELTGKKGKMFFTRFGTILWFALFATLVAFLLNTAGFYFAGINEKFSIKFTLQQAMALGALLSPTDPVTVLALFREIAVDPVIETVVLGESLLNDAVAILLYRMVVRSGTKFTVASDVLWFGYMFALSMLIGLAVGLGISLLIKVASYRWRVTHEERVTAIETAIVLVSPWFSYLIAETLDLSGVVAVLFCGIAMARYAIPNFSDSGTTVAKNVYASFSQLAETLAFVLLGFSAFAFRALWSPAVNEGSHTGVHRAAHYGPLIILHIFTIVFVSLGRVLSITFTAGIVNVLLRTAEGGRLPQKIQWIVSLSGLRGAVAVALALKAKADIGGAIGSIIVSTTLIYVLFTILVVGPCLPRAFKALGIEDNDPRTPIRHRLKDLEQHNDRSARHILMWQYMVHGLRRLDGWIYAFVTARGADGEFIGDSMVLWRSSSSGEEEEIKDVDLASTPTTIVISDP